MCGSSPFETESGRQPQSKQLSITQNASTGSRSKSYTRIGRAVASNVTFHAAHQVTQAQDGNACKLTEAKSITAVFEFLFNSYGH